MSVLYDAFGLFIDGAWRPGAGGATEVMSPVSEQPVGTVATATAAGTEAAIAAAARGLAAWRSKGAFERADALHAIADEMAWRTNEAARMISTETGKPLVQSGREWGLAVDQFRWYAEEARRIYGRVIESRVPGGRFEVGHEPVGINGYALAASEVPFRRVKYSGMGREGGIEGIVGFLDTKLAQIVI